MILLVKASSKVGVRGVVSEISVLRIYSLEWVLDSLLCIEYGLVSESNLESKMDERGKLHMDSH